ncbi:DUF3313 domain-containing protein [Pseudomonas sp. NPDC098747]|uniref:DUF3313 domain-containing protein n=1 Tax=Pseudomonas sp. NPDC098747 TaxID=3364487 RepID=UPI00383AE960
MSAVVLIGLAGCSTIPKPESRQSGFLDDYSQLEKDDAWPSSQYWVDPHLKLATPNKKRIYLEPPLYYLAGEDLKFLTEHPEDVSKMLRYLHQALLYEFLTAGYEITTQPEANTFLLRTAITGAKRTPRDVTLLEYLPIGMILSGSMHFAGFRDESVRIFFESELRDAQSKKLLGQSVSVSTGNNVSPRAEATVEDTYLALDMWAKQLRERADKTYSTKQNSHPISDKEER